MIVRNVYEVIEFVKDLPTIELKAQFMVLFEEYYTCEIFSLEDIIDSFVVSNFEELIELGYLVEID